MTGNLKPKVGAILLAAGGSSRLGRPKQLLQFGGETLLRRAARTLTETEYFPIVVVLGAEPDSSFDEIKGLAVHAVINPSWARGMSSSIRKGLETVIEIEPEISGVLITLCDQPRISAKMLNQFSDRYKERNASVVAAAYNGVAGVPALFGKQLFDELKALDGDKGARSLIRNRPDLSLIDLPEAEFDIDTPDDVKSLDS